MIIDCIKSAELTLEVLQKEYEDKPNEKLKEEIVSIENKIKEYKNNMKNMPEIENRIYYKIVYEGKRIMKAITEVADENYQNDVKPSDVRYIHRKYHKKIKKLLKDDEKTIKKVR